MLGSARSADAVAYGRGDACFPRPAGARVQGARGGGTRAAPPQGEGFAGRPLSLQFGARRRRKPVRSSVGAPAQQLRLWRGQGHPA